MEQEKEAGYKVGRVTLNGVEMLLTPASKDPNEAQVERIFAAFAAIEEGEQPAVIISTTTTMK